MKYLIILCLFLTGCVPTIEVKPKNEPLHLVFASDLHYFSPQLHDNGERFQMMVENGDGKMVELIEEVSEAFIDQMIEEQVDAVVLSGDITLNGERLSHEDLAKKLHRLKENGIEVYLLPGNHDMNTKHCYQYEKEGSHLVEGINERDFKRIYREFYKETIRRDFHSLSYVVPLRDDLWLLALDGNSHSFNGGFDEGTWTWIEKQLEDAKQQGKKVISVTHQNSMIHNDYFVRGYVLNENKRLLELFEKYQVKVNFSGHLHVQHIAQNESSYDVANSSVAVSPNQYSDVIIDENQMMSVKSKTIKVSEWATKKGMHDERLLNYDHYAKTYFTNTNSRKLLRDLDEMNLSESQREAIRLFVSEMNYSYFAGNTIERLDELLSLEGYQVWLNCEEETRFDDYMASIIEDAQVNNYLTIQL